MLELEEREVGRASLTRTDNSRASDGGNRAPEKVSRPSNKI